MLHNFTLGFYIFFFLEHCLCGIYSFHFTLTVWRPAAFGDFRKKTPKRTWLCVGISPVRYALQTW